MYRITLSCEGIPPSSGPQGAIGITEEFTHRTWHQNVACSWDGRSLILVAENDYDENGLALRDEFWDAVIACIADTGDSCRFRILEIKTI